MQGHFKDLKHNPLSLSKLQVAMESIDSSLCSQQHPNLPPGFRFHPTNEELVVQYLKKKVASTPLPVTIIAEIDLYKFNPWELPKQPSVINVTRLLTAEHNITTLGFSQPNESPESMTFYGISYSVESSRVYKPATQLRRIDFVGGKSTIALLSVVNPEGISGVQKKRRANVRKQPPTVMMLANLNYQTTEPFNPLVLQIPIGAEDSFQGVVDLVKMKAIVWSGEELGAKFSYEDNPDDLQSRN
ncbi:hypothetical protein LguiB_008305 [Lonicera macranthoides]